MSFESSLEELLSMLSTSEELEGCIYAHSKGSSREDELSLGRRRKGRNVESTSTLPPPPPSPSRRLSRLQPRSLVTANPDDGSEGAYSPSSYPASHLLRKAKELQGKKRPSFPRRKLIAPSLLLSSSSPPLPPSPNESICSEGTNLSRSVRSSEPPTSSGSESSC